MHKLIDYVCDELTDLEKKAEKDGLSMSEIQYADTLAHLKKNLMKAEEMELENEYSQRGYTVRTMPTYYGNSYAGRRNAKRDSMGRYSRSGEDMARQLRDMADSAPEEMRGEIHRLADKMVAM